MATISCRSCGQVRESYEDSQWCVPCVNGELALQKFEDEAPVEPQVFGVLESA